MRTSPFLRVATFTCMLLSGCRAHKAASASDLYNDQARIVGSLPYPVLQWSALSTSVDRNTLTTATLFGNETAVAATRRGQIYPVGSILGLVTWHQRSDPHWFGGRIPADPLSVDIVEFSAAGPGSVRHFAGSPLTEKKEFDGVGRLQEIRAMLPVQLPGA
jgi:hypothetical protein